MDFDEVGRNVKELFKDKRFRVACIVVAMVAIVLWIIRQNRKTTTTTTTETFDYYDGTQAIGYGGFGYPYAGGDSSSEDYDWLYERLDSLADQIEESNAAQDEKYEGLFDALNDRLDGMGDADGTGGSDYVYVGHGSVGSSGSKIDEQAIIDAMEANSNAWWGVTDAAGRDYLHQENQYLASQIGASYDNQSGMWFKDGLPLYNVNKGDAMAYVTGTGSKPLPMPDVGYVANIDYQAAINEAIVSGQSADVINQLNAARDKKVAATGSGANSFDPNTDYQALINKAKAAGADQSVIDNLTKQRQAKIAATNTKSGAGTANAKTKTSVSVR